ncbi:TPA: DUF2274 domain-containing protein [Enterococcus faecium]|nr:DUF2274 domain-containing protein [Enterococcus faecium]HAQ9631181.1 DUF2274 domain-containing protein [Enterococcus faecium]
MSKADEMRARAARATQRTTSPSAEAKAPNDAMDTPATASSTPSVVRSKPVRITADLSPQVYRGLIEYAAELASTQGRARVAHVHVVRALVAELVENEELQKAIARRVRSQLDD